MKSFNLNPDYTAVVGTGTTLGDLSLLLFNQGKRALPHGSCPYVRLSSLVQILLAQMLLLGRDRRAYPIRRFRRLCPCRRPTLGYSSIRRYRSCE